MDSGWEQATSIAVIAVSLIGLLLTLAKIMTVPLARQVETVGQQITDQRTETTNLISELRAETTNHLSGLRTEIMQQFAQMNGKLDGLAKDMSGVRERVARIEERFGIPAEPFVIGIPAEPVVTS